MSYLSGSSEQRNFHLYNGKELQTDFDLDWYDYGARFYDPQLGRWHVPDPMIEKHFDYSGYAYVYNNPTKLIDPFGLDTVWVFDQEQRPEDDAEYTAEIYVEQNGEVSEP